MPGRVYIETTIPSFYYEARREPEMVARRNWTRKWWDQKRKRYEAVTSVAVMDELKRGDHPNRAEVLVLLAETPVLAIEGPIDKIVDTYVEHQVMPSDPQGDALHLALASYNHCRFLLTWNCAHLANANKFEHIRHVNSLLGLFVPTIVTPVELLAEEV